jgi:hypothetical protein
MSIMSWLHRVTAGDENVSSSATFAAGEENLHGLNMKEAIDAHVAWKTRLAAQLSGTDSETLEIGAVASDDRCELGMWIHSEGEQRFSDLPEFAELRKQHAQFHLNAGNILLAAHNDGKEAADKMLHGSEFRQGSDLVQLGLVRLYARSLDL